MKRLSSAALGLALLVLTMPCIVSAGNLSHNSANNVSCSDCHNSSAPASSATFNGSCLTCHGAGGAAVNKLADSDQATTSHRWSGSVVNPDAGAQAPATGAIAQVVNDYTDNQLACVDCHNPHDNNNGAASYLRIANDKDQVCLDCHRSRDAKSHRVDPGRYPASHPVNVTYSDAAAANSTGYNTPPLNANPNNPNSDLGARLTVSGGVVLCSTCHATHNAYSQSANPPVADSNGNLGDGNLLRTDPRGGKVGSGAADKLNICTNCHAGKMNHNAAGQDIQCLDCHAAHVEYDPNDPNNTKGRNIDLIRRNLPGRTNQVFFRYTGANREYKNADGTGVCQGCHQPPASISQHASNDPAVCNTCHTHNNASGAFAASMPDHKASLGSGNVLVFSNSNIDHGAGFTIPENCTLCHYESLVQQHGGQCPLCHGGTNPPRNSFNGAAWNKTCSQGSCHPTIHAAMGADHNGIYWNSSASCSLCHDTSGGSFPGSGDNCTRCHAPNQTVAAVGDHVAPTTTSDAQGSYIGAATIHLSATDVGSGVAATFFFNPYHNRFELGTDVYYSAPTSGSRVYTLQFYSIDYAMNIEPVKSVTFTISSLSDTTAPVTTSSFNPAAGANYNAAQAVTLSATDSGAGVKATYYKIDAGAFVQGTVFTVTGDGLHTFTYYSADNANNTETAHVSNQFRIDTTAPVTTSTAVNGTAYAGNQTFTLTATDTGSGVAGTWYRLDGGALTSGTSIAVAAPASGSASHTISWYSTDIAGNQETAKSVTVTLQAVTDTTAPVTTSGFNPAAGANYNASQAVTLTATDNSGGSGVKATYYKIDAGAFVQGTTFTITGDGLHTFTYYSVDNANNTETAHVSNQFRIDTIAPVTSNNAVAGTAYTGNQTFTLTATDSGSGVASTWYKLDGAASFTQGTSIAVTAPSSGSTSHTISWYSIDAVGNQEAAKSVTFTVTAAASGGGGGTATLIGRNSSSSTHPYTHFWVNDASDTQLIADGGWSSDEHITGATFVVPAGSGYVMHVEWEYPDYEVGDPGSDSRVVSPLETVSGATVTWQLSLP